MEDDECTPARAQVFSASLPEKARMKGCIPRSAVLQVQQVETVHGLASSFGYLRLLLVLHDGTEFCFYLM